MASSVDEKTKQKIVSLVSVVFPRAKIYLFGSRARGTHSPTSDVDIAIDDGGQVSYLEVEEVKNIISASDVGPTVDVVDFHSVPEVMRKKIEKERVVWKS